jgi:hypothetical protein
MTTYRVWQTILASASFRMLVSVREQTESPNFRLIAENTLSTALQCNSHPTRC